MPGNDADAMTSLEARVVAVTLAAVQTDVAEIRTSLAAMQRALDAITRMDEQQINQRAAIGRAFDEITEERKKREAVEARMHILEVDAPSYKELRRWVIGGVLAGLGLMGVALFNQLVVAPMDRGYAARLPAVIVQPPPTPTRP